VSERLEIRLYEEGDQSVSLKSMSSTALESFVKVVSALKELTISTLDEESVLFSIQEGSAQISVEPIQSSLYPLVAEIESAIGGKSDDSDIITPLRAIQKELKRKTLRYNFNYIGTGTKREFHDQLIKRNRLSIRRKGNSEIKYELKIERGFFNQIGGTEPNYHFDYGNGEKLTIECSMDQARLINKHLYTKVCSLLISKSKHNSTDKNELYHKVILDDNLVKPLKEYLKSYNSTTDLVDRLSVTHDFIDDVFKSDKNKFEVLRILLTAFNFQHFHLSELKTMLVISKPFKEHESIKVERQELLNTYSKKKAE